MAAENEYLQQIRFLGRSTGPVKTLSGFKKGLHTVPDAINATTNAFLSRLCAYDLASEAEDFFQRTRADLGYKRKDLTLDVSSPHAAMQTRDFHWELSYAFAEATPETYLKTRALSGLKNAAVASRPEFGALFSAMFTDLVFILRKGAPVEPVIDAVEAFDDGDALRVDYPSHARECTLTVADVAAQVRFDGSELALLCPRAGSPGELIEQFLAVRSAFKLTRDPILSGLLG